MVLTLNTISGQIADVSPKLLEHPKFKDILQVVNDDAKPYTPELYKPGTKQEKAANRLKKPRMFKDDEVAEEVAVLEEDVINTNLETEEEI